MSCRTTLIKKLPCFRRLHTAASSNSNRLSMVHLFSSFSNYPHKHYKSSPAHRGKSGISCLVQLHHKSALAEESGFGILTPHLQVKIGVMCVITELWGRLDEGVQRHGEPPPAFDTEVIVSSLLLENCHYSSFVQMPWHATFVPVPYNTLTSNIL